MPEAGRAPWVHPASSTHSADLLELLRRGEHADLKVAGHQLHRAVLELASPAGWRRLIEQNRGGITNEAALGSALEFLYSGTCPSLQVGAVDAASLGAIST